MSPTSTARRRTTVRKITLCAAALVVAVLPTACGAAYADSEEGHAGHGSEVVEVGGADAAEPQADEEGDEAADDSDKAAEEDKPAEEKAAEEKPEDDGNGGDK
ncbi:MAG: hypothetical protein ACRDXB_01090, partial [Actinomycetes bacterium]